MTTELMGHILVWIFGLWCACQLAESIKIDNDIEGVPEVACLAESVKVAVQTAKPFFGHVYVKGQFRVQGCHLDLTSSNTGLPIGQPNLQPSRPTIIYEVPYRGCVVKRERTVNPPGLSFTLSIVVQFHHQFLTKVDRAYTITCFYVESTKTVTYGLDISMLETTQLYQTRPMPICTYDVLRGSLNGPPIRFAQVGEMAFHKWACQGAAGVYGMLVHSCSAQDGTGEEYKLIDSQGCAIDPVIVNDITYAPDLSTAYVEIHVFKFADKMQLSIQCQISLCLLNDGACNGITPPNCGPGHYHQSGSGPSPIAHPPSHPGSPPSGPPPVRVYSIEATRTIVANYPTPNSLPPYVLFPTPPSVSNSVNGMRRLHQRQRRREPQDHPDDAKSNDRLNRFERTLDLTTDDIYIFNMDDQVPIEAVPKGYNRHHSNHSPLSNIDSSNAIEVQSTPSYPCTSTVGFTFSLLAVSLFFVSVSAGIAYYQRRYYIGKYNASNCALRSSGFSS